MWISAGTPASNHLLYNPIGVIHEFFLKRGYTMKRSRQSKEWSAAIVFSFVALCASAAFAQNNNSSRRLDIEIPPAAESPSGTIETDAVFDNYRVNYVPDVVYAKFDERELVLNLILPSGDQESKSPLVVFIQGSAWYPQNVYGNLPQLADIARAGYAVASVEYRPSNEAKAPAQAQDVKAAIRFMRANTEQYNIDPAKVAVWGNSSGGHLAALTGTSDGESQFLTQDNSEQSSRVQAVVDFYGPTDFLRMDDYPSRITHNAPDSPESNVIGAPIQSAEASEKVRSYNPISYISNEKELPPFLIVHGDVDPLVPFNQSVLLYNALKEAGKDVTFYKVKGAGHGDGIWSGSMISIVIDFLDDHLQ